MTLVSQSMTLEDYLRYDDGTDTRYALENGQLVIMPPESDRNQRIASFLFACFLQQGIPLARLRIGLEIVVAGRRATTRFPDIAILSEELEAVLAGARRATVMLDMPPPSLVVEIVSPGSENRDRDYRYKRSEYAARGITEYWIVDPVEDKVTILSLLEGLYEEQVFEGDRPLASTVSPDLTLTATEIWAIG
ncbi:MAG: Uma2 family endonuclease [Cyanobacteria bacterium J06638_22]